MRPLRTLLLAVIPFLTLRSAPPTGDAPPPPPTYVGLLDQRPPGGSGCATLVLPDVPHVRAWLLGANGTEASAACTRGRESGPRTADAPTGTFQIQAYGWDGDGHAGALFLNGARTLSEGGRLVLPEALEPAGALAFDLGSEHPARHIEIRRTGASAWRPLLRSIERPAESWPARWSPAATLWPGGGRSESLPLPAGSYQLRASTSAGWSEPRWIRVRAGETVQIALGNWTG